MPDRLVRIVVDAQVAGAIRNLGQTEVALQKVAAEGTKTSTATGAAGAGIDKAGASASRAATGMSATAKAFVAVGAAAAGLKIADYVRDSVDAASDLETAMRRTQIVFGTAAPQIDAFGKKAAESVGLSNAAAQKALGTFGNMFTQFGLSGDAAANMSIKTVQLAADLGSLNQLPTGEVVDDIAAAFRGEYDALQKVIPGITDARIQQEALSATGKTSTDQLTAQDRAMAALAIITQDGAKAQGNFAAASDTLAVSQQQLSAQFEDQQAALGQKLLPAAKALLDLFQSVGLPVLGAFGDVMGALGAVLAPVAKFFGDLPGPVQTAVIALTAVTLLRNPLTSLGESFVGLGAKAKGMGAAIKGAFLGNPIGIAITAIATAFSLFTSSSDDATAAATTFTGVIDDQTGALKANAQALLAKALADSGSLQAAQAVGITAETYTKALLGQAGAVAEVEAKIKSATAATNDYNTEYGVVSEVTGEAAAASQAWAADQAGLTGALEAGKLAAEGAGGAAQAAGEAADGAVGPTNDLASAWADGKVDASEMADQVQRVMDKMDELAGRNGDAEAAQRAINAAVRDYNDASRGVTAAQQELTDANNKVNETWVAYLAAVDNAGAGSDEAAEAAKAFHDAETALAEATDGASASADGQAESAAELTQKMAEAGVEAYNNAVAQGNFKGAADLSRQAMEGVRQSFINAQSPADIASGKAAQLADDLGLIPSNVPIEIVANDLASSVIDEVEAKARSASGKVYTITLRTLTSTVTLADGSQFNAGQVYTGGYLGDLPGYAAGGLIPGRPPRNPRSDNILATLNGKPLKVRSGEFIMSEPAVQRLGVGALTAMNAGGTPDVRYADAARYATARVPRTAAAVTVNPNVRVFIGETELTDMVRVVVDGAPLSGDKWKQGANAAARVDV